MGRKIIFRRPIGDFSAAMRVELTRVETGDSLDAALLRAKATPKIFATDSNAGDRTDAGNDRATPCHLEDGTGVDLFAALSRYAFMQSSVLPAMWWMKKLPMIGSAIGASTRFLNCRSCLISTKTPADVSWKVQTTCIPFVQAFR